MKKLLCLALILVFALCGSIAFAESAPDFAAMSDDELHALVDGARNELTKRELIAAEDLVLFEQDGVSVYLTGKYEVWGSDSKYLQLEAVLVNDSDKTVSLLVDSSSINGWEVYGSGITDTNPGKKQKGALEFLLTDADISTYEEVEEIEVVFVLYDSDNWETINTLEPIVIHVN